MIRKNTDSFSLTLDEKGALISLVSRGKEFVGARLPLFEILLRDGGRTRHVESDSAESVCINEKNRVWTLEYTFKDSLSVTVTIAFSEGIDWRISLENRTGYAVEWVNFPQIAVPNDLIRTGGSGRILLNMNEGMLCEDVAMRQKTFGYIEPEYPSEGLMGLFPAVVESPFLAYYDNACGLYLGAHDLARGLKAVDFYPVEEEKAVFLRLGFYPGEFAGTVSVQADYPTVMRFFTGSWESAAEIYRDWFNAHLPEGFVPLAAENTGVPEWYADSPLVVTYPVCGRHDTDRAEPNKLYPYANALPHLNKIAEEAASRLLVVLMQWESTAPWAPPYMWPPFAKDGDDGEALFRDFIAVLHEHSHAFGVYCSGTGFTIKSNLNGYSALERFEKDKLGEEMCTAPDGSLPYSKICTDQRQGYDMCISRMFTKRTLCDEAQKIASSGADYIQVLDQNHGGTPYFCYNKKHAHPPVPGAWQIDEMKTLLSEMKKAVGDKVLLGCESAAAESYLPYLRLSDNRFNLNLHCARPVPLYAYLYHEYVNNFSGNAVNTHLMLDIHRSPDSFFMRLAYSFIAGDLLTLVIDENGDIVWNWGLKTFDYLPDRERTLAFVKCATAFRRGYAKKFLYSGKMVRPCAVECEKIPMYKHFFPDYAVDYPSVFTSAWLSADGERAQFLANYLARPTEVTIDLSETRGAVLFEPDGTVGKMLPAEKCRLSLAAGEILALRLL